MSIPSTIDASPVAEVTKVAALFHRSRTVVLLAHINPDADTLGSALALGLALESLGVTVGVSFDFPVATPESLAELPGQHLITRDIQPDPDLVVSLDVASAGRLGNFRELLESARTSLVIDHHASNPGFGDYNWIDPNAEATVMMVASLIDELGATITKDIAANLYAGLATDTVNFRFATVAGHELAARLVDAGVQPEQVLQRITDSHPFRWLNMLGAVLSDATLDEDAANGNGLVTVRVLLSQAAGLRQEELDSIIDIARTAQEADVAAVIKQTDEQNWQVSLRARNGVDVGRVATSLGGGGHPRAAGYSYAGHYDELVEQLLISLNDCVTPAAKNEPPAVDSAGAAPLPGWRFPERRGADPDIGRPSEYSGGPMPTRRAGDIPAARPPRAASVDNDSPARRAPQDPASADS